MRGGGGVCWVSVCMDRIIEKDLDFSLKVMGSVGGF